MSDQELITFRPNINNLVAGSKCVIKLEPGIYDLDFSSIMLELIFANAGGGLIKCYRLDFFPGWKDSLIIIDSE